ncbi:MAG TPA: hypothetical protein VF173_21795 [Thermoanaerobaculia bacterium]|nr:hypothetical protein [Thermoanaerobaculia bacterium]
MRDLIKSILRFSWGMSLFGMRQALNVLAPSPSGGAGEKAAESLEAVTRAAAAQMDEPIASVFRQGERWQREMVDRVLGAAPASGAAGPPAAPIPPAAAPAPPGPAEAAAANPFPVPAAPVDSGRLSPARFVVLGEGLAAGMSDFGLKADLQGESFPAQMARQMRTGLSLPLIQAPGIGDLPGFPKLPVRVPAMFQTTVREDFPPVEPPQNLSVPGLRLDEAVALRPAQPIVHRGDAKRTAVNLILGLASLVRGEDELPTQLEAALRQLPTFALIELGYAEALEAAASADPQRLPAPAAFRQHASRIAAALRENGAEVLVMTVPDPMDTAYCSPLAAASRVLSAAPAALASRYGLAEEDRITVPGLVEIGNQILAGATRDLPEGCVVDGAIAREISARIGELNQALGEVAVQHGALLYDLHGLFRRIREQGVEVGGVGARRLTADFLGGFYTLNGYYPGRTGHAVIASEVLQLLNQTYGARFRPPDLQQAAAADPVVRYQAPGGPLRQELPPAAPPAAAREQAAPQRPARRAASSAAVRNGWPPPQRPPGRLQLPPGLEQTLPLAKRATYHGDAIRIVHCPDEKDSRFGSCGDLFFGGFVLYDSHLTGSVRIRFTPPASDVTHFEVTLGEGLRGDDGVLSAPQFFRWPVLQAEVTDAPGFVSSGDLNLATGEVSNLQVFVYFRNSALFGLMRANPRFPTQPIAFPGQYGSAWARFDPRPDGLLDFTFYGSTFLPLSSVIPDPVVWALPFSSPTAEFAHIPASGMAMHPHLQLSTREPETGAAGEALLDVPFNTVQELTLFTRNTSFGDQFTLNAEELGGQGKGRSQVLGRLELQVGERFGDSVSVALSTLGPGGLFANTVPPPLAGIFPGRLYNGPIGHNEFLRFPLRTYFLDGVNFLDDPFDVAVGAVDLRTGDFLNEVLRRGLIGQNLFEALVRIEPRTPQSSFLFRGPARLQRGARGQTVFRLKAEVHIPYPATFLFPAPDLASGFRIGTDSALDPFLWIQAVEDGYTAKGVMQGEARRVRASTGDELSYRYSIPADLTRGGATFEYTDHSQDATFRLHTLSWVSFLHSLKSTSGKPDTVTFSGYGTWSRDGGKTPHAVTVQIAHPPGPAYVSIQVGAALISNVNTKPANEQDALP